MSQKHSTEPWRTGEKEAKLGRLGWERLIFSEVDKDVYNSEIELQVADAVLNSRSSDVNPNVTAAANAARIVACVNFCAGISNQNLLALGNLASIVPVHLKDLS